MDEQSDTGGKRWEVAATRIYSLDRCIKCMSVLKLGGNTMATVILRRERVPQDERNRQ